MGGCQSGGDNHPRMKTNPAAAEPAERAAEPRRPAKSAEPPLRRQPAEPPPRPAEARQSSAESSAECSARRQAVVEACRQEVRSELQSKTFKSAVNVTVRAACAKTLRESMSSIVSEVSDKVRRDLPSPVRPSTPQDVDAAVQASVGPLSASLDVAMSRISAMEDAYAELQRRLEMSDAARDKDVRRFRSCVPADVVPFCDGDLDVQLRTFSDGRFVCANADGKLVLVKDKSRATTFAFKGSVNEFALRADERTVVPSGRGFCVAPDETRSALFSVVGSPQFCKIAAAPGKYLHYVSGYTTYLNSATLGESCEWVICPLTSNEPPDEQ